MKGTRWRALVAECLGRLHREFRISITRVPEPHKWVFVVGCYQSGKTLLVELLRRHHAIGALPQEGQFLTDGFQADWEVGLPRMWARHEELFRLTEADEGPDVVRLKKEWSMRLDHRRPVLLEESPPNAARTRWLQANFENAHFIALVRSAYPVVDAIRRKTITRRQKSWPLELCIHQWRRSNEILLEDSKHLKHISWVRYEDLADDPMSEMERLLAFLGLDADGLDYDPTDAIEVHGESEPVRNRNREEMAGLTEEEIRAIGESAGSTLRNFGYPVLS